MTSEPTYDPQALFGLTGRTILVTGAGGRLGTEIVSACLAAGARVTATDLDLDALHARQAERAWPADRVTLLQHDVRDADRTRAVLNQASAELGEPDGLVTNAGVNVFSPFADRTEEEFDRVTDINLKGVFWGIQAFAERCRNRSGTGAVVNVASHYGLISPDPRIYDTAWPRHASEVYCATKAGVLEMTRYFAAHLAPDGIRVNAVAPGGVRNPGSPQPESFRQAYGQRCPMGRMAEPRDIPGAVVFLLSPASSYITGQSLAIDGGMTAW